MKRSTFFVFIACLAAHGCQQDPARSVKVVERPATPPATPPEKSAQPPAKAAESPASGVDASSDSIKAVVPSRPAKTLTPSAAAPAAAKPSAAAEFHLDACPPSPETGAGNSTLTVSGPCAFQQQSAASCEALADDFIMVVTRPAKNGATVMVYVNVEKYRGPGTYTEAQMFVGVQEKLNIWRWSSDAVNLTVGAGEAFADLPSTRLDAEPMLVNCTGPMTNFQCGGVGDAPAFETTAEVVSGRLQCEAAAKPDAEITSVAAGRAAASSERRAPRALPVSVSAFR